MLSFAVAPELARRDAASQSIATPPPKLSTAPAAAPPLHHSHGSDEDQATTLHTPLPEPPPPFSWSACHNLISTDGTGALVRHPLPTACPAVKVQVKLQLPLLYSAERRTHGSGTTTACPAVKVQVKLQLPLFYSAERRTHGSGTRNGDSQKCRCTPPATGSR